MIEGLETGLLRIGLRHEERECGEEHRREHT
jgi:hypothetical protein